MKIQINIFGDGRYTDFNASEDMPVVLYDKIKKAVKTEIDEFFKK